jgi:hypothetical protein
MALTGDVIRAAGAKFYDQLSIPASERQKLSNGWLESFKERVGFPFGFTAMHPQPALSMSRTNECA